jgi:DNA-binding transcriptional ArsR family regulator
MEDDSVFRALADPHRRQLLDALFRADGQSLGELCTVVPDIGRFGVMKHLAVLADAGLVVAHRAGRSKLHYLNPVPIREIHDRWISKYATVTVDALVALRRSLEPEAG